MSAGRLLSKAGTLLRTVRHLRADQAACQVGHRVLGPLVRARASLCHVGIPGRRDWPMPWRGPSYLPPRETSPDVFTLLGQSYRTASPRDWNDPERPRLWLYTCHYLDDLAAEPATDVVTAGALLDRWMAANPRMTGAGWEPYPLSLRIVNIVKHLSRCCGATDARMLSLAHQASALEHQLEYHLRGNHLFANGKALIFAGAFCMGSDADRWLRRGTSLIIDQIREQFLSDGGHFERSPMYHGLLLWDLCDLVELSRLCDAPQLRTVANACRPALAKGLEWYAAMCHPDGDLSFFNDSTGGVAPLLSQVRDYALRNDVVGAGVVEEGVMVLAASGFRSVGCERETRLLFDAGSVGPAFQPGHAHAGTLSVELSVHGRRVLVNGGVSTYAPGPQRAFERGTEAHNTVQVDGADSSEVWSSFRVGRRARVTESGQRSGEGTHEVWAAHDGYARFPGQPLHSRRCSLSAGRLEIVDRLSAPVQQAVARFHLHPGVRPDPRGGGAASWMLSDGTALRITWSAGSPETRNSSWHPAFGTAVPNTCLEVPFAGSELVTHVTWGDS